LMGIVYQSKGAVKLAASSPFCSGLGQERNHFVVVVEPVGSVGNSRSEFSKRRWGTWAGPPPAADLVARRSSAGLSTFSTGAALSTGAGTQSRNLLFVTPNLRAGVHVLKTVAGSNWTFTKGGLLARHDTRLGHHRRAADRPSQRSSGCSDTRRWCTLASVGKRCQPSPRLLPGDAG